MKEDGLSSPRRGWTGWSTGAARTISDEVVEAVVIETPRRPSRALAFA
jgi:hypothetical protein